MLSTEQLTKFRLKNVLGLDTLTGQIRKLWVVKYTLSVIASGMAKKNQFRMKIGIIHEKKQKLSSQQCRPAVSTSAYHLVTTHYQMAFATNSPELLLAHVGFKACQSHLF